MSISEWPGAARRNRVSMTRLVVTAATVLAWITTADAHQFPPGCTVNTLAVSVSRPHPIVSTGDVIPHSVSVEVPDTFGNECQASDIVVTFFPPSDPPDLGEPCDSSNGVVLQDAGGETSFTLNPGDLVVLLPADNPVLNYTVAAPDVVNGLVRAHACALGVSHTASGDPDAASDDADIATSVVEPEMTLEKLAAPETLCAGEATLITYSYRLLGIEDPEPEAPSVANVNVVDDMCGPLVRGLDEVGNNDDLLDPFEVWTYTCQSTISGETTNIATATGFAHTDLFGTTDIEVEAISNPVTVTEVAPACTIICVDDMAQPIPCAGTVCPGASGLMYQATSAGGGVTYEWVIVDSSGFTVFCDTGTQMTSGDVVCVDVGPLCGDVFQLQVTATAGDCTDSCELQFQVSDTQDPVIDCPGHMSVECIDDVPAPDPASVICSDNCSSAGDLTVAHVGDQSSGGTCPTIVERTYRCTDLCGNSTDCVQIITVNDDTAPVPSCQGSSVECLDDIPLPGEQFTCVDNCSAPEDITIQHLGDQVSGTCPTIVTRTYVCTDECGNQGQCQQIFTVDDSTPPSATCPPAMLLECVSDVPPPDVGLVTCTDNCTPPESLTIVHVDDVTFGTCPTTITRTYRCIDTCGNSTDCSQILTVFLEGDACPECAEIEGACCLIDGNCREIVESACSNLGGTFQGAFTECRTTICQSAGLVTDEHKISEIAGGFAGDLDDDDLFARSVAAIGDLNGDGTVDLAVGTPGDDDAGADSGAVWILLLSSDGTVAAEQKITGADLGGALGSSGFGSSITSIGDLNRDGTVDLAVGAAGDSGETGSALLVYLAPDGTVRGAQSLTDPGSGFAGSLASGDAFGAAITSLGDVDGDGVDDLAVGSPGDDAGGTDTGSVWILLLNTDGTVKAHQKLSDTDGALSGLLAAQGGFGTSVSPAGDINADGLGDLAVGAASDGSGAVWMLELNDDGTVQGSHRIADGEGGFANALPASAEFGAATSRLTDIDGDGIGELAVGTPGDAGGAGSIWMLFLRADGTVKASRRITEAGSGFIGDLDPGDAFGRAITAIGDLNLDGRTDLAVGAPRDDDGGVGAKSETGAVWLLLLGGTGNILFDKVTYPAAGPGDFEATGNLDTAVDDAQGTDDVVVVLPDSNQLQIFLNLGNFAGSWQGLVPQSSIVVGMNPSGVAVGLLGTVAGGSDAYNDLAVSNADDNTVMVLMNDADDLAQFTPTATIPVGNNPRAVATGDFSGSGGVDVAVANGDDNEVVVLVNDTGGPFVPSMQTQVGVLPWAIDPEDVDGDRCLDMIVANRGSNTVSVLLHQPGPGGPTFFVTDFDVGMEPVDVVIADLDLDDTFDFATADFGGSTITIYLGNGAGDFDLAFTLPVGSQPQSIAATDLDGDGDVDLAITANDPVIGPSVQVLKNLLENGTLIFSPPLAHDVPDDPDYVASLDLNADPVGDLLTSNRRPLAPESGGETGSVTALLGIALTCPGDANGDGTVDVDDLIGVIVSWGTANPDADFDHDGGVRVDDLMLVITEWGDCEEN